MEYGFNPYFEVGLMEISSDLRIVAFVRLILEFLVASFRDTMPKTAMRK